MAGQRYKRLVEKLVQQGGNIAIWGCIAVALVEAGGSGTATLIPFIAGLGGNVMGNILDRATKGEQIPEAELEGALARTEDIEAFEQAVLSRMVTHEDVERLQSRFEQLIIAARSGSHHEHVQLYEQLLALPSTLNRLLAPPVIDADALGEIRNAYAEKILTSRHRRMSTGEVVAEAPSAAEQVREPLLEDTFVEPLLVGAHSLKDSTEEINLLLNMTFDDDVASDEKSAARLRLLRLRHETWEEVRSKKEPVIASKVLDEHSALALLGDPGAGKSTLLRWRLMQWVQRFREEEAHPVPLLVAVGDYAAAWSEEKKCGLQLSLSTYLKKHAESVAAGMKGIVEQALEPDGIGVVLMLDGLDEVPREIRHGVVVCIQEFIDQYIGEHKPTRVIVCSRFFGYEESPLADPVRQFVLVPFDDDQIRAYSRKWYVWLDQHLHKENYSPTIAEEDARKFQSDLFSQPQITELARNPLMLSMIAVVVRQGKRLPERRVELYDQALKALMTDWERLRGENQPTFKVDYGEACQLWSPLARWMHEVGTGAVHEKDLKDRLAVRLKELELKETADDWLTVRGDKCCLLHERGKHIFGFLHQTFQEYLAAMDICQDGEFVQELKTYIEDPRWHEVLRLACGYLGIICRPPQKNNVTLLLRKILDNQSPFENLLHRDLFLAASCLADMVKPRAEMERDIVLHLLKVATSGARSEIVLEAMRLLIANSGVVVAAEILIGHEGILVQHSEWEVRLELAKWLGLRTGPMAEALLQQLSEDRDPDVKGIASVLLWQRTRNPDMLEQVLERLQSLMASYKDEVTGILRKERQFLVQCLDASSPVSRLEIARLLLDTEHASEALQALVSLLSSENEFVRLEAAQILRESRLPTEALQALVSLLSSEKARVRLEAAQILRESSEHASEALQALVSLLSSEKARVRLEAAQILRESRLPTEALQALVSLLSSEKARVRLEAAQILRASSEHASEALQALVSLLSSEKARVRLEAAQILRESRLPTEALQALVSLLSSEDEFVRLEAAQILRESRLPTEALQALVSLLSSEKARVRLEAAQILRASSEHASEALQALVSLLSSEKARVRLEAAQILRASSEHASEALQALVSLLSSEKARVRLEAAQILRESRLPTEALQALVSLLSSENEFVRLEAAQILRESRLPTEALQALVSLLSSENEFVRLEAANVLLASEEAVVIIKMLEETGEIMQKKLDRIQPSDRYYNLAWVYATLATRR